MTSRLVLLLWSWLPSTIMAYPQALSIPVADTKWACFVGDELYFANPLDRSHKVQISRWTKGEVQAVQPLQHLEKLGVSLYAISGSPDGTLYLCYTASLEDPRSTVTVVGKLDRVRDSVTEIWRDRALLPRRIGVSPLGYIYAFGLSRAQELQMRSMPEGVRMTVNILHVIDPHKGIINSLVPVSIDSISKKVIRGLLAEATIAFRRNGNFVISFDPVLANLGGLSDVLVAREYTPDGSSVTRVYQYSDAPNGGSVAGMQIDLDDSTLIQYKAFTIKQGSNPLVNTIRFGASAIIRFPRDGGSALKVFPTIPSNERLIGVRGGGELITEDPGKRLIRIWQR